MIRILLKKKIILEFNKCWGHKNTVASIKRESIAEEMMLFKRKLDLYMDKAIDMVRLYDEDPVDCLDLCFSREYPRTVNRSRAGVLGGLIFFFFGSLR